MNFEIPHRYNSPWLGNIGLLLTSCIVSLGLAEIAVRVIFPPPQTVIVEIAP